MSSPQAPSATGNTLSIVAIVCGVLAVLFLPIVFGPIGIVLGIIARSKGERLATTAIIVAAAGMVLGFILGALVLSNS